MTRVQKYCICIAVCAAVVIIGLLSNENTFQEILELFGKCLLMLGRGGCRLRFVVLDDIFLTNQSAFRFPLTGPRYRSFIEIPAF